MLNLALSVKMRWRLSGYNYIAACLLNIVTGMQNRYDSIDINSV